MGWGYFYSEEGFLDNILCLDGTVEKQDGTSEAVKDYFVGLKFKNVFTEQVSDEVLRKIATILLDLRKYLSPDGNWWSNTCKLNEFCILKAAFIVKKIIDVYPDEAYTDKDNTKLLFITYLAIKGFFDFESFSHAGHEIHEQTDEILEFFKKNIIDDYNFHILQYVNGITEYFSPFSQEERIKILVEAVNINNSLKETPFPCCFLIAAKKLRPDAYELILRNYLLVKLKEYFKYIDIEEAKLLQLFNLKSEVSFMYVYFVTSCEIGCPDIFVFAPLKDPEELKKILIDKGVDEAIINEALQAISESEKSPLKDVIPELTAPASSLISAAVSSGSSGVPPGGAVPGSSQISASPHNPSPQVKSSLTLQIEDVGQSSNVDIPLVQADSGAPTGAAANVKKTKETTLVPESESPGEKEVPHENYVEKQSGSSIVSSKEEEEVVPVDGASNPGEEPGGDVDDGKTFSFEDNEIFAKLGLFSRQARALSKAHSDKIAKLRKDMQGILETTLGDEQQRLLLRQILEDFYRENNPYEGVRGFFQRLYDWIRDLLVRFGISNERQFLKFLRQSDELRQAFDLEPLEERKSCENPECFVDKPQEILNDFPENGESTASAKPDFYPVI